MPHPTQLRIGCNVFVVTYASEQDRARWSPFSEVRAGNYVDEPDRAPPTGKLQRWARLSRYGSGHNTTCVKTRRA